MRFVKRMTPQVEAVPPFEKGGVGGISPSLLRYLTELRTRLIRVCSVFVVIFLLLFPFSQRLYEQLSAPLVAHLHPGTSLIATALTAPFWVPMKFSFYVACFLVLPFFFHQAWGFIAPALYVHERRWGCGLVVASTLLFYAGIVFAYEIIFPILFSFLLKFTPTHVVLLPDMSAYLDWSLQLLLAFGIIFEIPVICVGCVGLGMTTVQGLVRKRPYFIVTAFVIAMLIGPPDVGSQILLAVPMCLLFEGGILITRWIFYARHPAS